MDTTECALEYLHLKYLTYHNIKIHLNDQSFSVAGQPPCTCGQISRDWLLIDLPVRDETFLIWINPLFKL